MKVEITQKGVFALNKDGVQEELKIGSELTVKGDKVPASMLNKCRVLKAPAKNAKPVQNKKSQTNAKRTGLLKQADAKGVEVTDQMSDEDIIAALKVAA